MKPNLKGCKPSEDVCLIHCEPLLCRHGCGQAKEHNCKDGLPLTENKLLPCPHGRLPADGEHGWKHCPHCLEINQYYT